MNITDRTNNSPEGYTNASSTPDHPRHRWYFYKEGFSPELVETAINEKRLTESDLIIDPFNGSGTTTLVAAKKGIQSIGFEVNPFSAFLAKTKASDVHPNTFSNFENSIYKSIKKGVNSPIEGFSSFTRKKGSKKWLFNLSVIRAFEGGMSAIEKIDSKTGELYKMALLTSVMDNCNATKDGKCLRYIKGWKEIDFDKSSFIESFIETSKTIKEDLLSDIVITVPEIISGDSRKLINSNTKKKFKLCITSPPYLNSFDYTDIYRPELFLGRFLKTQEELYDLRLHTVRSHMQASWFRPELNDFGSLYNVAYNKIAEQKDKLWDVRIPLMIQAYFEDIFKMLTSLRSRAEEDASIWLVVSTSAYVGVEIPVDLIIAEIGRRTNWYLREVQVLRYMRSSSQSNMESNGVPLRLRESLVILDAKKPG